MPFARDENTQEAPTIIFDSSKDELRSLQNDYKMLARKFKTQFNLMSNKDDIAPEVLQSATAIVFPAPRRKFENDEIKYLKDFMIDGGNVLLMASEGKEAQSYAHINKLTEEFGIVVNHDAVVRTVYYKEYFHPKEAFIKNSCLSKEFDDISGKMGKGGNEFSLEPQLDTGDALSIAYPYGCTLDVRSPAQPLLSTGSLSFPANRSIMAYSRVGKGRLFVIGAAQVFDDTYFMKADNAMLASALMKCLSDGNLKLGTVDADRPEYGERVEVPDTEALAERVRACLQEGEELPMDFTELFDHNLFKYDVSLIPVAVQMYAKLSVKHEPLSLIPPQFEVPLPPLQPAVFMPTMRELAPPALDLFDLDEHFSSEKLRLAQLTNKCTDDDLEYYVRESGEILGVSDAIRAELDGGEDMEVSGHQVLYYIFQKLVNYKKMDTESAGPTNHLSMESRRDGNVMGSIGEEEEDRGGADVMTFD